MKHILNCLVVVLCIYVVNGLKIPTNDDCPQCKLCPIDDPQCCFLADGTMIPNGKSFNPDGELKAERQNWKWHNCANFTCIDGHINKQFYCDLTYKPAGTRCYHVGSKKLTMHEATRYCEQYGGQLAVLFASETALTLAQDITTLIPEIEGDTQGIFWLGASKYNGDQQTWFTGQKVADGYTNFKNVPINGEYIAAFSKENHIVGDGWYYVDGFTYRYPLCQQLQCERPITCSYKGKSYYPGEIIWKDPDCECSWIECGEYGTVKAVSKEKPCCFYNGEVFSNGEDVFTDRCSKLVCEEGKLVSYPYCGSKDGNYQFVPVTYNGTSSCYLFLSEQKTYEEAVRFCASHDSKLAELTSKGENEAVENFLLNQYHVTSYQYGHQVDIWLGGRAEVCDNGKLGHIHWTSAESRKLPVEAVYEDFCDNQPSEDTGAHCLYMTLTKEKDKNYFCWANAAGRKKKSVLCEKCASCEQIYKNVCWSIYHNPSFAHHGDLVGFGRNPQGGYNYGEACYEEHCENGKIIHRNFVCGDEYKQITPQVSHRQVKEISNGKKIE